MAVNPRPRSPARRPAGQRRAPAGRGRRAAPGAAARPPSARVRRRRTAAAGGLLTAVIAVLGLFAGCAGSAAPANPGSAGTTPAPASPSHASSSPAASRPSPRPRPAAPVIGTIGHYAVGKLRLSLADRHPKGLGGARLGPQTLPVLVRYPVSRAAGGGGPAAAARPAAGRYPLVVFGPGYIQCVSVYAHLLHAWASAGYVVAAVTFPETNCEVRGSEDDVSNQPADISYVITRLLAASAQRTGRLAGLISRREIAVAGHSDGADTAVAVAANSCCRDPRVSAAVVLAGQKWGQFGSRYFPAGSPPMLFVQGSADTVNFPSTSAALYQQDTAGIRFYLDVFGGSHLSPYETTTPPERLVAEVTVAFLDRYLAGHRAARAAMTRLADVPGVAHLYSKGRLP